MVRWLRAAAACALVLTAQACAKAGPKDDPPAEVQALLTAAYAEDTQGFEVRVDRPALRADLREQMVELARARGVDVGEGPSEFALDRMINPGALRLVQAGSDAPISAPPSKAQVTAILKTIGQRRVCLHDSSSEQKCVLTFARGDKGWKLVAMPASGATLQIPPEPVEKK